MKKALKIIGLTLGGVISALLLFMFVAVIALKLAISHDLWGGPIDSMGSLGGGKFGLERFNTNIALVDYRFDDGKLRIVVNDIKKYGIQDNKLYIIGYYSNGSLVSKDGINFYHDEYLDLKTGQFKNYEENSSIPQYLILDLKTIELKAYVTWEEVLKEDQMIFEKTKTPSQK